MTTAKTLDIFDELSKPSKLSEIEFDDTSLAQLQEQTQRLTLPEENSGRVFPAIQLNDYQPKSNSPIFWVFSYDMIQRLNIDLWLDAGIEFVPTDCMFYRDQPDVLKANQVKGDLRFIPLCIPKKFVKDKESGVIMNPQKGMDFGGKITVAKLFLGIIANGKFLCSDDGVPEIVTLNLRSFATGEVIGRTDNDEGTLRSLSAKLRAKRLRICNINLQIDVALVQRVSKAKSNKSSPSVKYSLSGAKLNSPEIVERLIPVLNDTEFQSYLIDPFRINQDKPVQQPQPEQELTEEDLEGMPF